MTKKISLLKMKQMKLDILTDKILYHKIRISYNEIRISYHKIFQAASPQTNSNLFSHIYLERSHIKKSMK